MNSKQMFAVSLIPILLLINFSFVSAKNVALAVSNANSLDPVYEQRLYDILTGMGNTVTLVDQNSNVDFSNFDLLVVAGRPSTASPLPATFAANLPVNSMPTIAIDYYNLYNWGWAKPGGVSVMMSGSVQSIYIASSNHPITSGYTLNQRVFVHNQTGLNTIDIQKGNSNFTFAAYLDQQGDGGIAFAAPNTQLTNGQSISSNSAAIFFGTTFPAYWTSDIQTIFENAVNWITNLNFIPPTIPVLSGPSQVMTGSAQYTWTASSGANGVQNYQIQISTTPDFKSLIVDLKTSSLSYTLNNMQDGQAYYVRVRSIDFLNLQSQWSNVITTIRDVVPIILTFNSPLDGATLQLGQNVFVNVSVDSIRIQSDAVCTITIDKDLAGTLAYNHTSDSCVGTITVPQNLSPGPTTTTFSASIQDELGGMNSTSITVYIQNRQTQATTTSTSATATTTATTSQNTGNSGSSGYYALLNVHTPTNLSYYTNSQNTFTITAKNEGDMVLHYVKVTVASHPALTVSINPDATATFDLNPGESKTYYINVQTPNEVGTYDIFVKSLSMETSETTRTIPVIVTEKPIVVDFGISSIEIPDFVAGTSSLTNITILNKGNVVGTANVRLDLPEGWIASAPTASVDIQPNQEAKLSFEVTPSLDSGTLTFSGDFTGNNETKTFSYPVPVTAKSVDALSAITSMLVTTLGNPLIAVPIAIVAAVAIAFYYKFKMSDFNSKYIWPKRAKASYGTVAPKAYQKNNFANKKTIPSGETKSLNNAYNKWEKSHSRS